MFNTTRRLRRVMVAAIGALAVAAPVLAGPALYWWHLELNIPHAECAQRAGTVIATEIAVDKIDKGPNGATAWNRNTTMLIYCTSKGSKKTEAIVYVSGFDGKEAQETMQQLRDSMRSAIHE